MVPDDLGAIVPRDRLRDLIEHDAREVAKMQRPANVVDVRDVRAALNGLSLSPCKKRCVRPGWCGQAPAPGSISNTTGAADSEEDGGVTVMLLIAPRSSWTDTPPLAVGCAAEVRAGVASESSRPTPATRRSEPIMRSGGGGRGAFIHSDSAVPGSGRAH